MAVAAQALPFGLREVYVRPIDAAGSVGTGVSLPSGRTLSWSETEDFEELRGDDKVVAAHGNGPVVEWSLESGGISLAAFVVMAGGSQAVTGTTPNEIRTFAKKTTDARPYFQIEGRAISDNGGDFRVLVYRCKADGSLEGELTDGSFWLTSASGKGYGNATDKLYDLIQRETAAAITP